MISLDSTLNELGIDETPALTAQEKTATIRDLLMFRSGIYIPAEGEHEEERRGHHYPAADDPEQYDELYHPPTDGDWAGRIKTFRAGKGLREASSKPLEVKACTDGAGGSV